MERQQIKDRLYEKYIAPTKKSREGYIGVEIEIPILNLKKKPVEFANVHRVTAAFMEKFGFETEKTDDDGNICAAIHAATGDILSYDCSYNNLELSMGKEKNLFRIKERFERYYTFLKNQWEKYDYTMTGMGVNPYRNYNYSEPIPNGRYRMLFHHLKSCQNYRINKYFHSYMDYGLFSSASQVQLDVDYEELIPTIRAFSKLEPIKAMLFSNSVLLGEREDLQCARDMFWEDSTHGINPHNIGMFEKIPKTVEELQAYIESASIYCVEREEKYINFEPIPILDYFDRDEISGEYYDIQKKSYQTIVFQPEIGDLEYLRTFKFEDLTFRGTIEFRSVCCQPMSDSMLVAAFHLGLKEKVRELDEILARDIVLYGRGYTASELRKLFCRTQFPSFVDKNDCYQLAKQIADLSSEGLRMRGYGEESLLLPLYDRIEAQTNPAQYLLKNKDDIEKVILEFGKLV